MQRFVSLVAAIAVAAITILPGPVLAQKTAVKNAASTNVRQVFLQRNAATMAILEADFPRDYDTLMRTVNSLQGRPESLDTRLSLMFAELAQVRRKYVGKIKFAPIPEQQALVAALGEFMTRVQADAGPEVCGQFAQDGSGALFQRGVAARFTKLIDRQSAAYFAAVVAAIETPEINDPAVQDDWAAVFRQMVADGHPQSYVATIARGAVDDPALCPAISAMLTAAAHMDEPEAARFRTEFATNMTGY